MQPNTAALTTSVRSVEALQTRTRTTSIGPATEFQYWSGGLGVPFRWRAAWLRWRANLGPIAFVWGVWLVLSWGLIHYVRSFALSVPYSDEWELVPWLTGHRRITWKWLWSQHNEHRIVIPRLLYLAVEKAAHCDFRAGAYFNVGILIASAAAMMAVAARLRGRTSYADAFFAAGTLHWGQYENLLRSIHIQWLAASGITTCALLLIVQPGRLSFRSSVALAICTIMLPLCGGNGLAFVPAMAICVFFAGWQVRKSKPWGKWGTMIVWALGVAAVVVLKLYFVDYVRPAKHPTSDHTEGTIRAATQFLVVGLGFGAKTAWPNIRYALYGLSFALGSALLATWILHPPERSRIVRVFLFFAGIGSLALGIGWARRMLSPDMMFSPRYATPAAAFWCAAYFGWEAVHHRSVRRLAQMCMFFLATAFLVVNRNDGKTQGAAERDLRAAPVSDLRAGVTVEEFVKRYAGTLYYGEDLAISKDNHAGPDVFRERVRMLRSSRIDLFKNLKE